MKEFKKTRLLIILAAITSFTVSSFAATNPLSELSTSLQEERMKAEDANVKSQQAITEIEAAKAALDVKKREIVESNENILSSVKRELTPEMLDAIMSLKIPNCKITKEQLSSEGRQDYTIENTDASGNKAYLRFFFNTKRTLLMPIAKPFQSKDGTHLVEISQPRFNPKNPNKDGYMSLTLIYNPETKDKEVTHAIFSGERRKDSGFFSNSDSNSPFTISCIIGN